MDNEGLRRNLDSAFDAGRDFPHRTLLSRSMAMLDTEPKVVRRGTRPLSVVVFVSLFLVAAYGLVQLHIWNSQRSIPARPTASPGSFTARNFAEWAFSANDVAVQVYGPAPGPLTSELEITHDGGRTWLRTGIKDFAELNLKWLDSQHIVIVGGHVGPPYVFEATSDGGIHWHSTRIDLPSGAQVLFTSFRNTSEGWALSCDSLPCSTHAIYHTTDSGAHWQELANGVSPAMTAPVAMAFTDSDHGFMNTDDGDGVGRLFVTADGGRSWRLVELPAPPGGWPHGTVSPAGGCGASTCVVLPAMFGHQGVLLVEVFGGAWLIYPTSDGGLTWGKPKAVPFHAPQLMYVPWQAPLDLKNWWVRDGAGGIYRTADGGRTWKHISVELPSRYTLNSVTPVASDTLWGTANSGSNLSVGLLVKSTDGGASWSIVKLPTP